MMLHDHNYHEKARPSGVRYADTYNIPLSIKCHMPFASLPVLSMPKSVPNAISPMKSNLRSYQSSDRSSFRTDIPEEAHPLRNVEILGLPLTQTVHKFLNLILHDMFVIFESSAAHAAIPGSPATRVLNGIRHVEQRSCAVGKLSSAIDCAELKFSLDGSGIIQ